MDDALAQKIFELLDGKLNKAAKGDTLLFHRIAREARNICAVEHADRLYRLFVDGYAETHHYHD